MGAARSKITKSIRNYNIEQRTDKALERAKELPKAAPRHESTDKLLSEFARDNPDFLESQKQKNEDLLSRLRMMKIKSSGPMPEIMSKSRPLPQERKPVADTDFGYLEPGVIPEGKTTIRRASELISQHSSDPQKYTAKILAESNKLDYGMTQDVLKYFKVFNLYLPNKEQMKQGDSKKLGSGEHLQIGQEETHK